MSWHLDQTLVERYTNGTAGDIGSASVESHLLSCDQCRRLVGQAVPTATLERMWDQTAERIDTPVPGLVERALSAVGVPHHVARIVAVTRGLQALWLGALVVVALLALLMADQAPGPLPFLILAPLVPMVGVAVVFAAVVEPGEEIAAATPVGAFRLLLYRAASVCLTAFAVLAVSSLALPSMRDAALWVLPALALTAASLAAGTRFDPLQSAVVLAGCWMGLLLVIYATEPAPDALVDQPGLLLSPIVQVGALVIFALSSVTFFVRRPYVELHAR